MEERCECGQWSGDKCDAPQQVTILWMPPHLRELHRAARNVGRYPGNGAVPLHVSKDCANLMRESESEWIAEGA